MTQPKETIRRLRTRVTAAEAALDRLRLGVITLDASGHVTGLNRHAVAILRECRDLVVRRNRLRCPGHRDAARLEGAIHRATEAAHGRGAARGRALAIACPPRPHGLHLLVLPVVATTSPRRSGSAGHARDPAVVVVVSDPEDIAAPHADWVAHLFHLTAAEARLAACLAGRHTLVTYAKQAGITVGTARWTLKRVLEKTGTRRQSELVHLLATSVAALVEDQ